MSALDIQKMSVQDRLEIMEAIWESFSYEQIDVNSPKWHRNILEERQKKLESSKAEFISLDMLRSKDYR